MHAKQPDTLDQALAALPRDVAPTRSLWPGIRAALPSTTNGKVTYRMPLPLTWQLAAGVALMIVSSAVTYMVMRPTTQAAVVASTNDTQNAAGDALALEYLRARADLDRLFAKRIAALPPATRAKLEGNLADLRRAASELAATLAEHPSDALLQELLMSTRQRELQLLADVSRMESPTS